jgi:ribosome biogenesis GTPase A
VTKTSPTTFVMEATDFYPPWNRELEILILNKQDQAPGSALTAWRFRSAARRQAMPR